MPGYGFSDKPRERGYNPERMAQISTRDPALARKSAETRYHVVHATIAAKGGHFPALEQPQAWMDDIRTFMRVLPSQ